MGPLAYRWLYPVLSIWHDVRGVAWRVAWVCGWMGYNLWLNWDGECDWGGDSGCWEANTQKEMRERISLLLSLSHYTQQRRILLERPTAQLEVRGEKPHDAPHLRLALRHPAAAGQHRELYG